MIEEDFSRLSIEMKIKKGERYSNGHFLILNSKAVMKKKDFFSKKKEKKKAFFLTVSRDDDPILKDFFFFPFPFFSMKI